MKLTRIGALVFLSSLGACTGREAASATGRVEDSASGTVVLGLSSDQAYQTVALASSGSLAGSILLEGPAHDSIVATGRDTRVCGDSASVTEVVTTGNSLANALVWVDGVSSGKPLPEKRRETLTVERCRFGPRVVGVVAGSTVNVLARDRVSHTMNFYREGAGAPVAHIRTMDAGQVVPSEQIAAKPGIVEARCSQHPWARGYVAVFDHPYFAVTDGKGAFEITALPPGTYDVKVWHEGLDSPVVQRVAIGAGGAGRLEVTLALQPAAAPAPRVAGP